jgi:aminomethyltransferase
MARRTALYDEHVGLGARMVEFAGWDMPVSYAGMLEEHRAVRERCGLFDVSHMGEIDVRGPGAAALCQQLTVNDVRRLEDGDGQYSLLCNEAGGVIDDLIVYRLAADHFFLIVNAANTAVDHAWIAAHATPDVTIVDRSAVLGLLALQGPEAAAVLGTLTSLELRTMRPFTIREARVAGVTVLVSRTGYTGEDGFELVVDAAESARLWKDVLAAAARRGGQAAGLGARDTLRLEAALPLCGTDMDTETSPIEAGLGWVVKLAKPLFVGGPVLEQQKTDGVRRRLVGIQLDEPGIPRHGHTVWRDSAQVGVVTSGTKSPTLGTFIGMAYVETSSTAVGTALAVDIRGRRLPARVVAKPFYRRKSQEA